MRIEQGVIAALTGASPLTGAASRVYFMQLPQQATLPAITLQRVGTGQGVILDGVDTLTDVRIQIDCHADTVSAVKSLADEVRALISDVKGDLGGVVVQFSRLESEYDLSDFDGDYERYRVAMDFVFTLHE